MHVAKFCIPLVHNKKDLKQCIDLHFAEVNTNSLSGGITSTCTVQRSPGSSSSSSAALFAWSSPDSDPWTASARKNEYRLAALLSNLQVLVEIPGGHEDEVGLAEAELGEDLGDLDTALVTVHWPGGPGVARAGETWRHSVTDSSFIINYSESMLNSINY